MKRVSILIMNLGVIWCLWVIPVLAADLVPLPNDIHIIPPSADLPRELAAFSGRWQGTWVGGDGRSGRDAILIIEEINTQEAKGIYAWSAWGTSSSGWKRFIATIRKDGGIEFGVREGGTMIFEIGSDPKTMKGTLFAHIVRGRKSVTYNITMKRED
jgi:hypothetical protein